MAKAGNYQKQQLRMYKIDFNDDISFEDADLLLKKKEQEEKEAERALKVAETVHNKPSVKKDESPSPEASL